MSMGKCEAHTELNLTLNFIDIIVSRCELQKYTWDKDFSLLQIQRPSELVRGLRGSATVCSS